MAIHNAIQMREAVDSLIDRVKSPRFTDKRYYEAINQAIKKILDDRVENTKQRKIYSVQSSQRLRNELYTLIVSVSPVPSSSVSFPSDYYYLLNVVLTVDGETSACRPLNYNEEGIVYRNPFKSPKAHKTYFTEILSGLRFIVPVGATISGVTLYYLKMPDVVSIGNENDKIAAGASVLTATNTYYVYEEAVHAGATYYEGETFVASSAVLTSGIVIHSSNVVNCNMPETLQDEIERLAAAILDGTVEDFTGKQDLKVDNQES